MTDNNLQNGSTSLTTKGFAMPVIIATVALVLVLGGAVYYASQSRIQEGEMAHEESMIENDAMIEDEDAMQKNGDARMEEGEDGAMMEEKGGEMMKEDEGVMMEQ